MPLVSVYLPTRDRPALLERAIRSVFAQTYPNVQLVVADDGSEAPTVALLDRLRQEAPQSKSMHVVRLERPAGACAARNAALAACEGGLVTGLDDDDYFLPERVARLQAAFDPARCAFVFDGYWRETARAGRPARRTRVLLRRRASLHEILRRNIVGNQVFTLTDRLRALGGFDERLPAWQDYDLWIRLARTYGDGLPAGGCSYVHTADPALAAISADPTRIARAFDIFLEKHAEYGDPQLALCLRMAEACYGIGALNYRDLPGMLRLGAPRHVLFVLYSYLANRGAVSLR